MTETAFHRNNHYVPRLYLKHWATTQRRIQTYRTLVSDPRVPLWRDHSIEGVAFHAHLYTQTIAGKETDDIERWLDSEFEAPAEEALHKAISDKRLTPTDWRRIVRFLAAQDVRTPARLVEALHRWETELPALLDRTLKDAVRLHEKAKASGKTLVQPPSAPNRDSFPLRVTTEIEPGEEMGKLKAEIVAGRALWLHRMPELLTKTANVLHQHRWTILAPPRGLSWFTSDDPVIRLNYYKENNYDFKGGWNNKGTEILLPLGPCHLLFTKVGERPVTRGGEVPLPLAKLIRRFIAEHATRMIFATEPDVEMSELRPRLVDAVRFQDEAEQLRRWHEEQSAAERKLRS
ncbi:MAG: hypothetical protein QOJ16_1601 [Acidobacteriota bacterium]|nr:hypothetical protein [Acidobacteriota bacterium]